MTDRAACPGAAEIERAARDLAERHLGGGPGRAPGLVRGAAPWGPHLIGMAHIIDALRGAGHEGHLYLAPEAWGADTKVDRPRVERYLDAGYPVIWRGTSRQTPTIAAACRGLEAAVGGVVGAGVVVSRPAATPFDVHFDLCDVVVVQVHGSKTWAVSRVRRDLPPGVHGTDEVLALMAEGRGRAEADVLMRVTVDPGDVLHLPRGQYHNACAATDLSIHVTFELGADDDVPYRPAIGTGRVPPARDPRIEEGPAVTPLAGFRLEAPRPPLRARKVRPVLPGGSR